MKHNVAAYLRRKCRLYCARSRVSKVFVHFVNFSGALMSQTRRPGLVIRSNSGIEIANEQQLRPVAPQFQRLWRRRAGLAVDWSLHQIFASNLSHETIKIETIVTVYSITLFSPSKRPLSSPERFFFVLFTTTFCSCKQVCNVILGFLQDFKKVQLKSFFYFLRNSFFIVLFTISRISRYRQQYT